MLLQVSGSLVKTIVGTYVTCQLPDDPGTVWSWRKISISRVAKALQFAVTTFSKLQFTSKRAMPNMIPALTSWHSQHVGLCSPKLLQ